MSMAFTAADEARARTIAGYAAQRLADFLPGFDKNMIAISREADPGLMLPLYCDQDIYCLLAPEHAGPCRDINGTNLDGAL
ncbi:hypothetical protein [Stackebrandtia nassauensis]|nr:hypothetical protein [Stackebrandtia nassauensis]